MAALFKDHYKDTPVPDNLSFDEESLFWRLRLGEGIPTREWHKPLDRSKTWHEIKRSLDHKVRGAAAANDLFHQVHPNPLRRWLKTLIHHLKTRFTCIMAD